jgi:hypothetical protein
MIMDERNEFADAASVAAAAGTALIGDVINLGSVARDMGQGEPVWFVVTVDTAFVAAGAGTINIQLVSDAQAAIATDGSATVHLSTGAKATAASTPAGQRAGDVLFAAPLPVEGSVYEQYLGVLCTIATQTVSAGKINAFLTLDPPRTARLYNEGAN